MHNVFYTYLQTFTLFYSCISYLYTHMHTRTHNSFMYVFQSIHKQLQTFTLIYSVKIYLYKHIKKHLFRLNIFYTYLPHFTHLFKHDIFIFAFAISHTHLHMHNIFINIYFTQYIHPQPHLTRSLGTHVYTELFVCPSLALSQPRSSPKY